MKRPIVFLLSVIIGTGLLQAQDGGTGLAEVTVDVDVPKLASELKAEGHADADVSAAVKALEELKARAAKTPRAYGPPTEGHVRSGFGALARELAKQGVPERVLHPVLWKLMGMRFPLVDATPLFAQLRQMGMDPTEIEKMTRARVRVFAKERTEVAEAQYEHLTNSLYLPPDYLEPGVRPPRLKTHLSSAEINTVIHELDHAEKDQVYDHFDTYGKSLGSAMMAGVRKFGLFGVLGGFGGLALSAIPKLATVAPWAALGIVAASVVAGAAYGAWKYYHQPATPPRDARQERVKQTMDAIARVIRDDPKQRIHPKVPLTESNPKSWEVSGYFMGDSVSDILDQIDTIKLHNHLRIRRAKTKAELDEVMKTIDMPPSLASRQFGTAAQGGGAFFRVKEIGFPYKEHPELFTGLYADSLGLKPPADAKELVARINADPSLFPELRSYLQGHAERRAKELEQSGAGASPAPAPAVDPSTPNYDDVPNR